LPESRPTRIGLFLLILALLLRGLPCAAATQSVALTAYLEQGREAGLNLIYASSLINSGQRIEIDPGQPFSLQRLRDALPALGLTLEELGPRSFVLKAAPPEAPPGAVAQVPAPVLEEIVIHTSRYRWNRQGDGTVFLAGEELAHRPVLANDALRVVNQLPGSASVGLSARPRVRGGRENETLIEFDAVRLYNPFHFASYNSLYSVFDARAIGEIDFYSGTYPLYLGDSLSAAMSIAPPEDEDLVAQRELGVGLYQLSYFQSAVWDEQSMLLSLRRSSPEAGQLLESQDLGHPEYGDAYLRYRRELASGRRWTSSLLWYGDDLSLGGAAGGEEAESNYGSGYAWTRLESAATAPLSWSATIGLAYLENRRSGVVEQAGKVSGELDEVVDQATAFVNQDFQLTDDDHSLSFGWELRYLSAGYDVYRRLTIAPAFADLGNTPSQPVVRLSQRQEAQQGALYAAWKRHVGSSLYVDLGLRVDAQRYANRDDLEPTYRLGVLYRVLPQLDLRAAWGRYTQSQVLSELPVADLRTTVPAPQAGNQLVLALDWLLPVFDAQLHIEGYRKDVADVSSYFDNLGNAFTLLPELQPDRVLVAPERYRADGVELSLEVPFERASVWANYAYSTARDRLDGRFVSRSWDQGRTFNAGVQTDIGSWELSLSAGFHEGWLSTPLALVNDAVVAGDRNSERFDHFITLDAKLIRRWPLARGELRVEAGVSNITDRQNQIGTDYRLAQGTLTESPFYGVSQTGFLDLFWRF
jgi:hypothetical protein